MASKFHMLNLNPKFPETLNRLQGVHGKTALISVRQLP